MLKAEERLKDALKTGQEDEIRIAFGNFYCSAVRLVYLELIQKFGRDDEIDDDVQMAFLSVYQKRDQLHEVKSLKRYVIQTALYIGERRRLREARMDVLEENVECKNMEGNVPRLCQEALAFEMVNRLLPHPDSDIVIMKAAYGYSEKEIAYFLHLGEDAVGYRYRQGIAKVKKTWKGR